MPRTPDLLDPFGANAVGRSLNFSYGPLEPDQVRAAFEPGDYARLAALRALVDPSGRLC